MVEVIWRIDDWLSAGWTEVENVLAGIAPGGKIDKIYGFMNTTYFVSKFNQCSMSSWHKLTIFFRNGMPINPRWARWFSIRANKYA